MSQYNNYEYFNTVSMVTNAYVCYTHINTKYILFTIMYSQTV